MLEWQKQIQYVVNVIDESIKAHQDEFLTLKYFGRSAGLFRVHTARKFKAISGMVFRDYLRRRKLAFALKEVRDSEKGILEIALDYGFSSHEAFTRALKTCMA